uniref:Large ribosomal subunit protein uL10-like insertion domain-containing protein n=1 Tax=Oryza meridionalis TaxID=40149 RepID=A0A0E0F2E3_9ORYZ
MANRANVSSLSTDIINQVGYEPRHLIISSHPGVRSSGTAKQEEEEAEMAAGDAATPLLETAYQYHEGCPACAVERSKALNPGIPYMRFFHIWIIILVSCTYAPPIDHCFMHVEAYERGNMTENSESSRSRLSNSILGLPISSLFPFLYFMIRDLHVAKRVEDIGFYAGFVSTSWAIGLIVGPAIGGYLAQETLHKHATERNGDCKIGSLSTHLVDSEEFAKKHTGPAKDKSLFKNWPLMSSIVLFCIVSFDDMAYTEIFSLWSESDKQFGGLNFSSEDVGQVLAITGASLLVYQLFIYPRINKILCIPILFAYPYMTYLSGPGLTIILNIASVIKNNLGVTIITGCFILQNNAVPQDQRGAANGLAMTGMSFFKAVAPAGAGIVFSWAQKRQHASFLPGDQMVFFLLNIFELLGLILTFKPFLAPNTTAQTQTPIPTGPPSQPHIFFFSLSVSVSNLNPHLARRRRRLALLLPDPESSSCELALAVAAMAIKRTKAEKKVAYDKKLCQLLDEYTKVLIAVADNVGSNQLQEIRKGLRGDSIVLMGKNTLIRRCIKVHADNTGNKDFLELMPLLVGNVGLIFTKGDLKEVREEVAKYKVGAPARVGLVAPVDVVVPPGNTGLDPSQTSFFQVLNIPTKINKGTVEIITPVELIKKGDKVGSSESALLAKLGIRPFSYGLVITNVYDSGSVFSPEVLDLTEEDLMEKFASGVSMVASVSLAISYPTIAAAPHMFLNGYKNVLAVAVETEYSYPHADKIKEYLKDPSKFAVAAPVAAADSGGAAPAASKEEEKKEEPEEESDGDLGMSLFD